LGAVFSLSVQGVQGGFHFPHACVCACASRRNKNNTTFRKFIPLHILHTLHNLSKSTTYKKSDGAQMTAQPARHTRTIRCTPENAAQMQQVVKNWPELHNLVKSLQEQNLFPGLRNLQITITGSETTCAKGLGALLPENAQNRE
jgi:hypothetical protein